MDASFKEAARHILLKGKDLERMLNALDSAHRHHRNREVEYYLKRGKRDNTKLTRLLFGESDV